MNSPQAGPKESLRVLTVGCSESIKKAIVAAASHKTCLVTSARDPVEARRILDSSRIDLVVTDIDRTQNETLDLVAKSFKKTRAARWVAVSRKPTLEKTILAVRCGAMDVLEESAPHTFLKTRFTEALRKSRAEAGIDSRMKRLRSAVRRLNMSRRAVSKKVDLLCNDLVTAYGELSKQVDQVRLSNGFRKCLEDAESIDKLQCNTLDWLLRTFGYSNIAIWLSDGSNGLGLGAYMKYTIEGQRPLTDAMANVLLPMIVQHQIFRLDGAELLHHGDLAALDGQDIIGATCTYLGNVQAVIVMFRDKRNSFSEDVSTQLAVAASIFAQAIKRLVRKEEGLADEPVDGEGFGFKRRI